MYEFFEDEKRYYIVTEYVFLFLIGVAESAKEENCSTRSLQEASSPRKMLPC
jgi:hypothetical protein